MDDLIELLKAGDADGFNAARSRRGKLDLFAADLSEVKAVGVDLANAILEKADLTDADLTDAVLARAILSGADLSNTRLSGVLALQTKWREAYLEDSDLSDADLSASDFSDAELHGCNLQGATLTGAKLKRTRLHRTSMKDTDLSEARLTEAVLEDVDLQNARMVEANLHQVVAKGAVFANADLTKARMAGCDLSGADLTGARLVEADLSGANLSGAKLAGADFTRADLTGVEFGDADLDGATFTDAQVDGALLTRAMGNIPATGHVLVEEPVIAAGGGLIGVLWENPTGMGERAWLRVAVGKRRSAPATNPPGIPVPPELVVARAMAPSPRGGIAVLVMTERPSGISSTLFEVDRTGAITEGRRVVVPYTPAARPILQLNGDDLLLYGISREGPGLHVHCVTDAAELDTRHASLMKTVRGFVSDHHPVVLSKGGVLIRVGPGGPGQPMTAPSSFPGRRCGAAPAGDGVALAWLPSSGKGLGVAGVEPGVSGDERILLPKAILGGLDVAADDQAAWAAFTREPDSASGAATAWGIRLPDGQPFPIVDDPEKDVTEIRMVADPTGALAAVTLLDGALELYALRDGGAELVWRIG